MAIIFKTRQKEYQVENKPDKTIFELARETGLFIKSSCGGNGKCGQCMVNLKKGKFLVENREIYVERNHDFALSCLTKISRSDAIVEIPGELFVNLSGKMIDNFLINHFEKDPQTQKIYLNVPPATLDKQHPDISRVKKAVYEKTSVKDFSIPLDVIRQLPGVLKKGGGKITATLVTSNQGSHLVAVEPEDTTSTNYAVALDIGTTTVIGLLTDLTSCEIAATASLYNQQINVAGDVISRISYCKSRKEIEHLKKLVIEDTIHPILQQLCSRSKISPENIYHLAVSGNTVMMHLLLGLDPSNIGQVPFQPVVLNPGPFRAGETGIGIHKNGIIDFIPAVSGYIGGDIVSDIYVSKLNQRTEFSVLIDLGTNGEIVISENGKTVACSTAAGPAFEGYGLYHGSRASEGAIEKVFFKEGTIRFETIHDQKAIGICGTGIIDFIAEGLRAGLIDYAGKFNIEMLKELALYHTVEENGSALPACVVAKAADTGIDGPIIVTQNDIISIMQAKAAIYAGLKTLLFIRKKNWSDIKRLVLTGGFAGYITLKNAVRIGLLPDVPEDRIKVIGNGSLAGAYLALIEPLALEDMDTISRQPNVIELNSYPEFQENFIEALFFQQQVS
ncbi:DUF4445 domain-containing protein [candidate division KSB1 bacterium]|nr:DUF4445 domain-containing protein [candidate division KSB1 bacterium]